MKKYMFAAFLALALVALVAPQPVIAADDEKPFTIHGEVRWRSEYTNNTGDLNDSGTTDDQAMYFPYRVRIAAEGNFTKNVHAWVEFQNTGVSGDANNLIAGPRHFGSYGNDTQLYQGNITFDQLWSKNFSLRIGRQEIVAGNGLLLGNEEFYGGISHDGAVGTWHLKKVNVMVWYTRPFEGSVNFNGAGDVAPGFFDIVTPHGADQNFLGGYATWTWKKDQNFDVYLMDLRNRAQSAMSPTTIDTIGARYAHDSTTKNGFIWNIEYAKQMGKISKMTVPPTSVFADADFDGHAIEGWFGYNWKMGKNVHRVYGRLEQASGDKTNTNDKIESFQPMFGDVHNRLGRGDWFFMNDASTGLANGAVATGGINAWSAGYNGFYNDKHEFGVAYWKYETDQDVVDGSGTGSKKSDLGNAIDVWYGYNFSRNTNFVFSISQLQPGDLLKSFTAGKDDPVQRVYGQVRLRF